MRSAIDNPMGKYAQVAKQLENPAIKLDVLARYAQGQNPAVPEFLALAEIKRRQSLNQHSPAPAQTTVQEDLVRAATPAPMQQMTGLPGMQRPQGVAALPTGMDEQSMAGGGIVAFDDGGYVNEEMQYAGGGIVAFAGDKRSDVEDPFANLSFEEKLKALRAAENQDTDLSKNAMFRRNVAMPDLPKIGSFSQNLESYMSAKSKDADAQPGGLYGGGKAPTLTPDELGRFIAPPSDKGPSDSSKNAPRKASNAAEQLGITQVEPKEDMFGKYEKMFNQQAADAKAGREQDKWMRLLEAGLGIMGGTSQHALTNIGQGAMGAAKGYAQDKAGYRKEDRQNVMDLMSLGMKKEDAAREAEKLAIMRKEAEGKGEYYGAYADFLKSKGANLGEAGNTKMDIATLNAIGRAHTQLLKDSAKMGSPYYGKSSEELMQIAKSSVLNALGKGGGGAPAPTTVQWGSLSVPTKS